MGIIEFPKDFKQNFASLVTTSSRTSPKTSRHCAIKPQSSSLTKIPNRRQENKSQNYLTKRESSRQNRKSIPTNPHFMPITNISPNSAKSSGERRLSQSVQARSTILSALSDEAKCGGYLCAATAASVDGYTSYGAAVVVDGFKNTFARLH